MSKNLQTYKKTENIIQLFNNTFESGNQFNKSFDLTLKIGEYVIKKQNKSWDDYVLLGLSGFGTALDVFVFAADSHKLIKATGLDK